MSTLWRPEPRPCIAEALFFRSAVFVIQPLVWVSRCAQDGWFSKVIIPSQVITSVVDRPSERHGQRQGSSANRKLAKNQTTGWLRVTRPLRIL